TIDQQNRSENAKISYTNTIKTVPWDKEHLAKNLIEFYKDPAVCFFSNRIYPDHIKKLSEKFYEINPEKGDYVISKNSYDAFTNPEIDKLLKKKKIRYLITTGVLGEGCVHSTIQGGFSKGYNFIILKDLVETTDDSVRQRLQKIMKGHIWPMIFGKTISSKDVWKIVSYK
ncbi:MAG: isochorismatase family protein, partial [Nanoarchaeota archaeon]